MKPALLAWFCLNSFSIVLPMEFRNEESLRKTVHREPTRPQAHLNLATWHLGWNETQKAIDALLQAVKVHPAASWRYLQRLGDIHYELQGDLDAAEVAYRDALAANPQARRSVLRYGDLIAWRGKDKEARELFEGAVVAGLLRDARQRPLEFFTEKISGEPWVSIDSYFYLEAIRDLAHEEVGHIIWEEYANWTEKRLDHDGVVSKDMVLDPENSGRLLRLWIHQPHFDKGVWRNSCSYKTPKTCMALQAINETGIAILRASFDVFEPGVTVRAHCHTTNRELFVDLILQVPHQGVASTTMGGELWKWRPGDLRVLDGSFEHAEENAAGSEEAPAARLRLVIRHPSLPCEGGWSECGIASPWRKFKSMLFGSDGDGRLEDELLDEPTSDL